MTKRINVVGAVIVRENAILAAQRSATMVLPLTWEFPGGKIEPGETPEEALRRELSEELLCAVDVGAAVETTTHEYKFGVVTLTTFYATLVEGDPTPTEHSAIRWIPFAQLDSVNWAPADVPTVRRLMHDWPKPKIARTSQQVSRERATPTSAPGA